VKLSDAGQSRFRGYLFMLERALQSMMTRDAARAASRDIESRIRARVEAVDAGGDERAALERVLGQFGAPERVARSYAVDRTLEEAVTTGRVLSILRAIVQAAFTTTVGFLAAIVLFTGYVAGFAFLIIGIAKPIFPDNVGFWTEDGFRGLPTNLGFRWGTTDTPAGGNWVIVIGLGAGLVLLALTHWGARSFLAWYRERRSAVIVPLAG
jgi:hypothetical protein